MGRCYHWRLNGECGSFKKTFFTNCGQLLGKLGRETFWIIFSSQGLWYPEETLWCLERQRLCDTGRSVHMCSKIYWITKIKYVLKGIKDDFWWLINTLLKNRFIDKIKWTIGQSKCIGLIFYGTMRTLVMIPSENLFTEVEE